MTMLPGKIQVTARVRPCLPHEASEQITLRVTDMTTLEVVESSTKFHNFKFDNVFDMDASQEEVYSTSVAEFLESAFDGSNVTIMACGPTGAGKTYTLLGTPTEPGIFSLALLDILRYQHETTDDPRTNYLIAMSAVEVYNDKLCDLLDDKAVLRIRESISEEAKIVGAKTIIIDSTSTLQKYLSIAASHRTVAKTSLNDTSSRSHAIFFIELVQAYTGTAPSPSSDQVVKSRLAFVDLAGSERMKSSGAVGKTMMEAQGINKSLSSLANVIHALHLNQRHIPFRDCKLTRILKSSMVDPFARVLLIANVAATLSRRQETCIALRFADSVKQLKVTNHSAAVMEHMELPRAFQVANCGWSELCAEIRICRQSQAPLGLTPEMMDAEREKALLEMRPTKQREAVVQKEVDEISKQTELYTSESKNISAQEARTLAVEISATKKAKKRRMMCEELVEGLRQNVKVACEESLMCTLSSVLTAMHALAEIRTCNMRRSIEVDSLKKKIIDDAEDVSGIVRRTENIVSSHPATPLEVSKGRRPLAIPTPRQIPSSPLPPPPSDKNFILGKAALEVPPNARGTPLASLASRYEATDTPDTLARVKKFLQTGTVLYCWTKDPSKPKLVRAMLSENFRTIFYSSSSCMNGPSFHSRIPLTHVTQISLQRPRVFSLSLSNGMTTSSSQISFMASSLSDLECWVLGLTHVTSLPISWGPPSSDHAPLSITPRDPDPVLPAHVVATCLRYHVDVDVAAKVFQTVGAEPNDMGTMSLGRFRLLCASLELDMFRADILWGVLRKIREYLRNV